MSKSSESVVDVPVVNVGDKIKLKWAEESGTGRTVHAKVHSIEKSSKKKHGTFWKYNLCLYKENNEILSTRLLNLPWELKKAAKRSHVVEETSSEVKPLEPSKKKAKHTTTPASHVLSTIPSSLSLSKKSMVPLESLRHIVAPMVGGSELAFRLLCRRYGATIAYTPMMNSEKFAVDEEYRKAEFQTTPEDRPVVAHFSANNPRMFLAAAQHVQDQCDAIGECQEMTIFVSINAKYVQNSKRI